jgi:hypothetical protein
MKIIIFLFVFTVFVYLFVCLFLYHNESILFVFQLADLRLNLENEKSALLHEVHVQKELMMAEHEKEMEHMREQHRSELRALDSRYKDRQEKDAKVRASWAVLGRVSLRSILQWCYSLMKVWHLHSK